MIQGLISRIWGDGCFIEVSILIPHHYNIALSVQSSPFHSYRRSVLFHKEGGPKNDFESVLKKSALDEALSLDEIWDLREEGWAERALGYR